MKRKIKYIILFLSFFLFIGLQLKQEIERNIIYNKVNNLKIKPTNEQINDYLEITFKDNNGNKVSDRVKTEVPQKKETCLKRSFLSL